MELDRDDPRFECDICGHMRTGMPSICPYCGQAVCDRCLHSQAGRGHLDAEHRHEIAVDAGTYHTDDE